MCLSADEVNPLCDECFAKCKEASRKGIEFKDEDMCDECRGLTISTSTVSRDSLCADKPVFFGAVNAG